MLGQGGGVGFKRNRVHKAQDRTRLRNGVLKAGELIREDRTETL